LFGVQRFTVFGALALLLGGPAFLVVVGRDSSATRRVRALAWTGWVSAVVATVAGILLQGPYATGSGIGDALDGTVVRDVLGTRYGDVGELRLLFLALALPFLVYEARASAARPLPRGWLGYGAVIGLLLAATPGLAGHASAGDGTAVAVPLDALHVAAMSVWFGGLAALGVTALGGGFSGSLRRALVRFSALATVCVLVLVATGLYASWRQVGFRVRGYTSTSFGNLLLWKLAIVALFVALAAVSRRIVHRRRVPSLDAPDDAIAAIDEHTARGLRRSVGGEVLLGIAVLAVTALLVNAQPARSALEPRVFTGIVDAGSGTSAMRISVTVDPARVGSNTIHLFVQHPDGTDFTIRDMSAELSLPSAGIERLSVPKSAACKPGNLCRGGPNHFLANDVPITAKGTWKLVVHVLLRDGFTDVAGAFDLPVR
jgi:copper transport protein